ncbi:hypothetical protein ACNUDM_20740 [Vibrio chaetopteri]|uniref:hypothetical protein n=1 Tax=Vibrio chaetopteri TaxID=3016528 RepID=UPI003AB563C6
MKTLQFIFGFIAMSGIVKMALSLLGFASGAMSNSTGYGAITGENLAIGIAIFVIGFVPYVILRFINARNKK